MSGPLQSVLIFLGAGVGANVRYWLGGWVQARLAPGFPWGTLLVNVSGSLLIGFFLGLHLRHGWPDGWRLLLAVGLLGGYTTFSAFSYETLVLLREGQLARALAYVLLSVLFSFAAVAGGDALARAGGLPRR